MNFKILISIAILNCCMLSFSMDLSSWYNVRLNEQLILAVGGGDEQEIYEYLCLGADINYQSEDDGETPLYVAVQYGKRNIVNYLLKNGANVNGQNRDGQTPLFIAAQTGNYDMSLLLINAGANLNIWDNSRNTPLFLAVGSDNLKVIDLLLLSGAYVGMPSVNGMTPLHESINRTHDNNINRLIKSSSISTINIADDLKRTALHFAVLKGNKNAVSNLLSYGADCKVLDMQQQTPLDIAKKQRQLYRQGVLRGVYDDIVEILKNFSKDSKNQDKDLDNFVNPSQGPSEIDNQEENQSNAVNQPRSSIAH
jgi:ankyrin repeat protein